MCFQSFGHPVIQKRLFFQFEKNEATPNVLGSHVQKCNFQDHQCGAQEPSIQKKCSSTVPLIKLALPSEQ